MPKYTLTFGIFIPLFPLTLMATDSLERVSYKVAIHVASLQQVLETTAGLHTSPSVPFSYFTVIIFLVMIFFYCTKVIISNYFHTAITSGFYTHTSTSAPKQHAHQVLTCLFRDVTFLAMLMVDCLGIRSRSRESLHLQTLAVFASHFSRRQKHAPARQHRETAHAHSDAHVHIDAHA